MNHLNFGDNCSLTNYLKELSNSHAHGIKSELAGALLYGLGYPEFREKLPDIETTVQELMAFALEADQGNIFGDIVETCKHCPQSASCSLAALFTAPGALLVAGNYLRSQALEKPGH